MTTNYSIIPSLPLDPRNESNLLAAAAHRVYEASNGRINDFTSGSPVMALLEGQVFAGAELLYWLNQLPEAVVLEWMGPLLGIQRKLGTPSKSTLKVEIVPHSSPWVLKAGFTVRTNSSVTASEPVTFTTNEDLIIEPQQSIGYVSITSIENGVNQNVETGSITEFEENLAFLRNVENIEPATGGTDEESLIEIKQRAYSYIRRRNPVSKTDWVEYIKDLIGRDSVVLVRNRRASLEIDETLSNVANHVSFFLLGPNNQVLSNSELNGVAEKIRNHVPINTQAHVFNLDLQDIDFVLTVSYNPVIRGGELKNFAIEIRNALANIILPNVNFEIGVDLQLDDIKTFFAQDFAYISPNLEQLIAYSIPSGIRKIDPQYKTWETGLTYTQNELISSNGTFYKVLESFDPLGSDPDDAVNDGILQFNRVKNWENFPHRANDIIKTYDDINSQWNFHLVLAAINGDDRVVGNNITAGRLSQAKTKQVWTEGLELEVNDFVGSIDDDLDEVYLVKTPYTVRKSGSISEAVLSGYLSQVTPERLEQETDYVTGDYVYILNNLNVFDYYLTLQDFTYETISSPVQEVYNGNLIKVNLHTVSPSTFRGHRYKARFKTREFVDLFGDIYQVGLDFTPDGSDLTSMVKDRLLYPTEFSLNSELGGVTDYTIIDESNYVAKWKTNAQTIVNSLDTLTDGDGNSCLLKITFTEGKAQTPVNFNVPTVPNNVEVVAPGAEYAINDRLTVPQLITANLELDRPARYIVNQINGPSGGVTQIIFDPEITSAPLFIKRKTYQAPLKSYATDSKGSGAIVTFDYIRPSVLENIGYLTNIRVSSPGNGYYEGEVLYADFTGITDMELVGSVLQVRVNGTTPQFNFKYKDFYKFYEGELVRVEDRLYVANRNFTPTLKGENYYIDNNIITEIPVTTQNQLESADELFKVPIEYNIPSVLSELANVNFFDNKASIYASTTKAFDGNSITYWESREQGPAVANTSYLGVDLGFDAYISEISFLHTASLSLGEKTASSFELQYSIVGVNGPWKTIKTGTDSELMQNFEINMRARYWRFIAIGTTPPSTLSRWRISNIIFRGDIVSSTEALEDLIIVDINNSVNLYRTMRTFTPLTTPREAELNSQLLKVVRAYSCDDYIKHRSDYSAFDAGSFKIDFYPHGSPNQITRYVIENKTGETVVFSYEPGSNNPIINYRDGTIAL